MLASAVIIHFCVKCCSSFIWTAEDRLVCLARGEHVAKVTSVTSFRFWNDCGVPAGARAAIAFQSWRRVGPRRSARLPLAREMSTEYQEVLSPWLVRLPRGSSIYVANLCGFFFLKCKTCGL